MGHLEVEPASVGREDLERGAEVSRRARRSRQFDTWEQLISTTIEFLGSSWGGVGVRGAAREDDGGRTYDNKGRRMLLVVLPPLREALFERLGIRTEPFFHDVNQLVARDSDILDAEVRLVGRSATDEKLGPSTRALLVAAVRRTEHDEVEL